jgi:hypothetical protein
VSVGWRTSHAVRIQGSRPGLRYYTRNMAVAIRFQSGTLATNFRFGLRFRPIWTALAEASYTTLC